MKRFFKTRKETLFFLENGSLVNNMERWLSSVESGELDPFSPVVLDGKGDFSHVMFPMQYFCSYIVGEIGNSCSYQFNLLEMPENESEQFFISNLSRFAAIPNLLNHVVFNRGTFSHPNKMRLSNTHHSQRPVLHHAIGYDMRGHMTLPAIVSLLSHGADPNGADAFGVVPLMLTAALPIETSVVFWDLLISFGADPYSKITPTPSFMGGLISSMCESRALPTDENGKPHFSSVDFIKEHKPDLHHLLYVRDERNILKHDVKVGSPPIRNRI